MAVDLRRYIEDIARLGHAETIPKEVWSIYVESTGTPSDMDEVLPVLLTATQAYIGKSTDSPVRSSINGTDKQIKRFAVTMTESTPVGPVVSLARWFSCMPA